MKLRRRLSLLVVGAIAATTLALAGASPALAQGRISVTGNCGDVLELRVAKVGDPISISINVPSNDPNEVWNLAATQQDYDAANGGRLGSPINLVPNPLPPLTFQVAEAGFFTTGDINNTDALTHGVTYTATRTAPSPLTCSLEAFWTNPAGTDEGPAPQNPTARPNTAPRPTGDTEVDVGTNDALVLMDQEMLASGQGIPAANRFIVRVNGISRGATAVQIFNDDPPFQAILDVTFGGVPIADTDSVTLQYAKPLGNAAAQLQDLEALKTTSFGPVPITVIGGAAASARGAKLSARVAKAKH